MTAELIDGKRIAAEVRAEVAEEVSEFRRSHGTTPGLAVVLVGDDPASAVYVRSKRTAAAEVGMEAEDFSMPADASQEDLLHRIRKLNEDPGVHGILVQLPIPSHIDRDTVVEAISPDKDVDGLHPFNAGLLVQGKPRFVPATPAGIQQLLLRTGRDPSGRHVVVCGRSDIVGRPVAVLLAQQVPARPDRALAMGQPRMITADMVKEGVVVIDVGVNRVEAPERKRGYRLVGDVDFGPVAEKADAITPVPGGVGPMTIAMLLDNTLKAARLAAGGFGSD